MLCRYHAASISAMVTASSSREMSTPTISAPKRSVSGRILSCIDDTRAGEATVLSLDPARQAVNSRRIPMTGHRLLLALALVVLGGCTPVYVTMSGPDEYVM